MLYLKSFIILKISLVIFFLLLIHNITAQTKYGIIAGAGKSDLYKFEFSPEDYNRYSSTGALWAGITADVPLVKNSIHLFSTAAYNKKGYKYLMQNQTGAVNSIKDSSYAQSVNYVDVTINLRKKIMFGEETSNNIFAGTGPSVSLLAGGKEKIQVNYFGNGLPAVNNTNTKLTTGNAPGKYKPAFFSWNFTAGVEINNFSISLNANIPLVNSYQDIQHGVKYKLKTFGINLGYTLYTHHKKEKDPNPVITQKTVTGIAKDTLKDTDKDGIADVNDKCPGKKGLPKYMGCPVPDTDGDGIDDELDKCITQAGVAANNGCPAEKDSIKPDTACYTIYFEPGKNILRSEAYATLNIIVKQLKANNKLIAIFTGHSDNVGSEEANNNRSLLRATTCADYLASFYLDKKRLTIIALGNKKPAADLNDPLLQWKNRRVEICIFEKKQ